MKWRRNLRIFLSIIMVGLSTKLSWAEAPSKAYTGLLTPTKKFGIFVLMEEHKRDNKIVPIMFDKHSHFFRLRGIITTPEKLRDLFGGTFVYCEESGSITSSTVGRLTIVDCRSEGTLSLGRSLLSVGAASPICSEINLPTKPCT